jgi:hypothetical protein
MKTSHPPFIRVAGDANIAAISHADAFEVQFEADVVLAPLPATWPMACHYRGCPSVHDSSPDLFCSSIISILSVLYFFLSFYQF